MFELTISTKGKSVPFVAAVGDKVLHIASSLEPRPVPGLSLSDGIFRVNPRVIGSSAPRFVLGAMASLYGPIETIAMRCSVGLCEVPETEVMQSAKCVILGTLEDGVWAPRVSYGHSFGINGLMETLHGYR